MKKKRYQHKGILILIVILMIVILIIGGTKIFYNLKTLNSSNHKVTGIERTTAANGYKSSASKDQKVISSSSIVVKSTGAPNGVKVVSKGSEKGFVNLSSGSFTIYEAHNPEVFKTATSITSPVLAISDVMSKYPNALIMNASGFNMSKGTVTGFQINNGKLFKDWKTDKRANSAFIINKNGSTGIYDYTTPASTILKKGAEMSFSFGAILVENGKVLPSDGTVNWMIHSFIGSDSDNNIYLIISDTDTGYSAIIKKMKDLNLKNVIMMDGGGSSQMAFNGKIIYKSQDDRSVNDYIILK